MPISKHALNQFTGSSEYTRWSPLFPKMVLTDGTKYVAENGGGHGAYWLMDAIASYQPELLKKYDWAAEIQFWVLTVDGSSAVLICQRDSGEAPVVSQEIEYTDFDLDEIKIWVAPMGDGKHYVLMLASEY
jgi:glycosyltransferase A (GT-A) superfamily protein (DUF2064 family)